MYDLTQNGPFQALRITAPATLSNDADYTQLFHYLISEFHRTINAYTARYGYSHRQRLLGALLRVLKGYMPLVEPELVRGYPGSLERIELLIAQAIIEAAGRVA